MKKYIPFIIIVVLVAIIAVGGTYIVMKGQIDKSNDEKLNDYTDSDKANKNQDDSLNSDKKSEIKLISTKEEGAQIVQTFNAYMNGKTLSFKVNYEYNIDKELPSQYYGESKGTFIQGKINGDEIYYRDKNWVKNSTKEQLFNVKQIEENFNDKNFRIVKGSDNKDYLVVVTHMQEERDDFDIGRDDILYVYNDELEKIEASKESECTYFNGGLVAVSRTNGVQVKENPWYKNDFNFDKIISNNDGWSTVKVKVESDKIFYLTPVSKNGNPDQMEVQERVYKINNNKLTYEIINTYTVLESSGGIC